MRVLREIRCPRCHRLQCKAILNGTSAIQILCRCKTMIAAYELETVVVSGAASPTQTFDGVRYDGFSLTTR